MEHQDLEEILDLEDQTAALERQDLLDPLVHKAKKVSKVNVESLAPVVQ